MDTINSIVKLLIEWYVYCMREVQLNTGIESTNLQLIIDKAINDR